MAAITEVAGFLSPQEIATARQQVFDLRDFWHDPTPEMHAARGAQGKFMMFGDALYRAFGAAVARPLVREKLVSEFAWLHKKLFAEVERLTGRPCRFCDDLPVPGFHISELDIEPTPLNMHQDNPIIYNKGHPAHAVICLLDAGEQGAWLEYLDGGVERKLTYALGTLYLWGPDLWHRIGAGSLKVKPGESRMTLQGFFYVDPTDNHNVLFF